MAKKYYAVRVGKVPGIYNTWAECQAQTNGVSGASFKSFENYDDAVAFINNVDNKKTAENELPKEDELFVYVDGSFNKETYEYGFGVVIVTSKGEIFEFCGKDNKKGVSSMRNVAGELKGAMWAVQYITKNYSDIKNVRIFHDYEGIAKWVTGDWKTNLEYTEQYKQYMNKMKKKINISFEKVKAHKGVKYNVQADKLAKSALGI